ncbi:MAG: hypothetical protein ACFFCS_26105 [Candidatus Hodarchaeota archaeon]
MSEEEKIGDIGRENMLLAAGELTAAKQLQNVARAQVKKAKARRGLMDAESEIAKHRENLAKDYRAVTRKKENLALDGLLEVNKEELGKEEADAEYHHVIARLQTRAAKINEKIAQQDVILSQENTKLANLIFQSAKARKLLGKKQLSFVDIKKKGSPEEKIKAAMNAYLDQQKIFQKIQKQITEQKSLIRVKQNNLADTRKELSETISELEKIRHK